MPKLSVVLTSYNHASYLKEAIDSVLEQTFRDFELIIWDDCSSDSSWEIICSYTDKRIKRYRNEVNLGGGNINRALEVSTGEYVAIHHSDDIWCLDKIDKQVSFLDDNSEVAAVFTHVQFVDENGHDIENDWFNRENKSRWEWLREIFSENNHLNHPSAMLRRACIDEVGLYKRGLRQTPDAEMWSRILIKFPIHVIQEKLTRHRWFSDDSNTSGSRLDVIIRLDNEWNVTRKNFLTISTFDQMKLIFPALEVYERNEGWVCKFLVSMACLYECQNHSAWGLGIELLHELMANSEDREKLRLWYGFTPNDLIAITGEFDVYNFKKSVDAEIISATELEITKLKYENEHLIRENGNLRREITNVYRLLSWRLTKPVRYIGRFIRYVKNQIFSRMKTVGDVPSIKGNAYMHYISLGDNCEVGLQLVRYGYNESSFFRYVACDIDALMNLINKDFDDVFGFVNVVPSYDDMVRDEKYNIALHSKMRSSLVDGKRAFDLSSDGRAGLYSAEKSKVKYLLDKWREQIRNKESAVYFIKSNKDINEDEFKSILEFVDPENSGRVKLVNLIISERNADPVDERVVFERISRFAPYNQANDAVTEEYDIIFRKYGLLN